MPKDAPLNVLFVAPYPPRHGGTAASLVQLTVALQAQGHTVRVLAPITPDGVEFDRVFVPTLGGVRVNRYLVPYFLYIYSSVPFDERYRRIERKAIREALPALIEAEPPHVIVAAQEPLAWYVPQIAKEHGVPCVLLLRGDPTWRIVQGDFPAKESREWLEAFSGADRIVAVAEYFAEGLRSLGLEKVSAIPNHVDLSRFAPAEKDARLLAELGIGQGQVVVAHISKIEPRKRPLDVVASAVEALRVCPDLVYLIVGEGPLLHEMEAACRRAAVADRFRFPGWVDYSAMPALFNLADVVAQPSEGEGMSRAYLESMACGRVLVASDIPAAREVVRHGESGLLFRTADVEGLTHQTLLAARDPALRARIGESARATVAPYSLDRVAEQFVRVFRDLLSASKT